MKYLLAVLAFFVSSLALAQTTITFGSGNCQIGISYTNPSVYCYGMHADDGGTVSTSIRDNANAFVNGTIYKFDMNGTPEWTSVDFAGTVTGLPGSVGSGTISGTFTALLPDGTQIVGTLVENFVVVRVCTVSGYRYCRNRTSITDGVIAY